MYDMENVDRTDENQGYDEGIVGRISVLSRIPDLMTWFLEVKDRETFAEALGVMPPARGFDAERCTASIGDLFERANSVCLGEVPGAPVVIEFDVPHGLATAERIAYVIEVREWAREMGAAAVYVKQLMQDGVAAVLRGAAGENPETVSAYWG